MLETGASRSRTLWPAGERPLRYRSEPGEGDSQIAHCSPPRDLFQPEYSRASHPQRARAACRPYPVCGSASPSHCLWPSPAVAPNRLRSAASMVHLGQPPAREELPEQPSAPVRAQHIAPLTHSRAESRQTISIASCQASSPYAALAWPHIHSPIALGRFPWPQYPLRVKHRRLLVF